MPGYGLKRLAASDIDKLTEIENQSFNSPWSKAALLNELNNKNSFNFMINVPENKKQVAIAAYISYRIVLAEMHILKIAVSPEYRNRKIATHMLTECMLKAIHMKANIAYVETRVSNTNAIKLYEKLGFKQIGIRKNYYQENGEDAIVFEKKLEKEMLL